MKNSTQQQRSVSRLRTASVSARSPAELQAQLDVPGSTLTHHLAGLRKAGLLNQSREGRVLRCVADYARLDAVIDFLVTECCAEER